LLAIKRTKVSKTRASQHVIVETVKAPDVLGKERFDESGHLAFAYRQVFG
jgi:hypothetical protein